MDNEAEFQQAVERELTQLTTDVSLARITDVSLHFAIDVSELGMPRFPLYR